MVSGSMDYIAIGVVFTLLLSINESKMILFKNRSDENLENSGALALISVMFFVVGISSGFFEGIEFSGLWRLMLITLAVLAFAIFRIKKLKIVIM